MGFAAGFAAGYEAVDKGRREEEARQKALQDAADKVAEAKKKDMVTATSNTEAYDKQALEYENKILNSKDDTEYNAHVTSLKSLMDNRVKLLSAAEKAGFSTDALDIMKQGFNKQYEPITKTEIPTYDGGKKEVYLPQSLASQSNNLNLSETGTIGKAILGSDNKIVGYQPTEIQPIKFKQEDEYGKGFVDVNLGGKQVKITNKEYMQNRDSLDLWKEPKEHAPTEGDKDYYSYVSDMKKEGKQPLSRWQFKQESGGGKVDATYKTKFDNAYNKILKDNPNIDEVDARAMADEQIRSTQSERTGARISNMEKALTSKFKVNNVTDININEARKDKTNEALLDGYFNAKAKDLFGQTWQDDVKVASQSVANADKVFDAGNVYAQDIIKGKSGVNVVNRLFDNTVGSYINKNLTSDEKLAASKDLASIMNVVRNEQFGAVVPVAEQTNFNDAATNLAKSSPDIVRGTISMLKQQKESIQTSKDILGSELFTVKFGDKLEKLDDKISKLESALGNNKSSTTKKPLDLNQFKIK